MSHFNDQLYWKWNNIDLRIQRNMTQQRLNSTTKGNTQQHNIEKDSNRLDKLKIRQLKKIQQNGSSSSKGMSHGLDLLSTPFHLILLHLWNLGLAITPPSIKSWISCFNLKQLFVLCPSFWWKEHYSFIFQVLGNRIGRIVGSSGLR